MLQAVALTDLLLRMLKLKAVGGVHAGMLQQIRMLVPSTALLVLRSAAISGCFAFATATVTRCGACLHGGLLCLAHTPSVLTACRRWLVEILVSVALWYFNVCHPGWST